MGTVEMVMLNFKHRSKSAYFCVTKEIEIEGTQERGGCWGKE